MIPSKTSTPFNNRTSTRALTKLGNIKMIETNKKLNQLGTQVIQSIHQNIRENQLPAVITDT